MLRKRGLVDAGHTCFADDVAPRDLEPSVLRRDRDLRGRIDVIGLEASLAQCKRQRHREAARMGRAQQFFGIGALAVLEA